jgi:hypothetical protein
LGLQAGDDINLTVDNFAAMGALLRGLFEYVYSASSLVLIPHQPDALTSYTQNFNVRWGPYSLRISTAGVRSSGIKSATVNGQPVVLTNGADGKSVRSATNEGAAGEAGEAGAPSVGHSINATALTLDFSAMPAASAAALASMTSSVQTASTAVDLKITFRKSATSSTKAGAAASAPSSTTSATSSTSSAASSTSSSTSSSTGSSSSAPLVPAPIASYSANDLSSLKPGDAVISWPASARTVAGAAPLPLTHPCPLYPNSNFGTPPVFTKDVAQDGPGSASSASLAGVAFDGNRCVGSLCVGGVHCVWVGSLCV